MRRRKFISALGAGAALSAAGCIGRIESDSSLVVATYDDLIDAPSSSPGAWIKQKYEEEFDRTLLWQSPPNEVNHYIERKNQDVSIDADVYLGLSTEDLVRVDENVEEGDLFTEAGSLEGRDSVKSGLDIDPDGRALPFNTGYICPVYDGTQIEAPETFEGLTDDEFSGDLIAQNPGSSTTGKAFLFHTIKQFGEDGYLDYWSRLQDNDVRVLGSWGDAYAAWSEGEAPMVVSFSTDQVFAEQDGANLEKHQIRFLNDQAYANPEGMAIFADSSSTDNAREFLEFILRPEVQGEIAQQNVVFPATDDADLPDDYSELAKEPPEPVTHSYDELQGKSSEWIENWEREFADN